MTDRTPDAIRSPLPFAGAGDSRTKFARLHAAFAGVLGVNRIFVRLQGPEHFVSGSPYDTLNYPFQDPRSGGPRYDWEDRGDGVFYGYRRR
jgi:hypothetical protein